MLLQPSEDKNWARCSYPCPNAIMLISFCALETAHVAFGTRGLRSAASLNLQGRLGESGCPCYPFESSPAGLRIE
jgi:hypothetical protein